MDTLRAPPGTPPEFYTAAIWGVMYAIMAIAAWLIWRAPDVRLAYMRALLDWGWLLTIKSCIICLQFGGHLLLATGVGNIALLGMTGLTIYRFWRLNHAAALLMLPYAAWVGFGIYVSLGFWWLNL
jgi:tryptophan-rich sensory protein